MSARKQTLRLLALVEKKTLDKGRFSAVKNRRSILGVWPSESISEARSVRSGKTRLCRLEKMQRR